MSDLQEAFVDAIDHLDLPEVDLTPAVMARIVEEPIDGAGDEAEPARLGTRMRRTTMAGVALIVALGLVMALTPAGRAVADWFGIGTTAFEVNEPGDDAESAADATELSVPDLGELVTPTPDIVPIRSLGRPDAVYDHPRRGRTYVWDGETGVPLLLSARSTATSTWAVKSLAAEDDVEFFTLSVPNDPFAPRSLVAAWVGAPHELSYPVEGLDLELSVDAGPVLIWVDDDVELRLEGAGRDEAVRLAVETSEGTELLPAG